MNDVAGGRVYHEIIFVNFIVTVAFLRRVQIFLLTYLLTYRQTTDGRPMTYSEHELEFTFAKK